MFTGKILPKLKFTITQAVNPHIQLNANKFVEKAVELPANISKKATNTARKVLNKDITLHSQPNADTVVLSSGTAKTTKATKTDNHNRGKNIKNILENHFNNEIDTALNEAIVAKEAKLFKKNKWKNLKKLVKSYEKDELNRKKKDLAIKESIKQDAIDELNLFKKEARKEYKAMVRGIEEGIYPDSSDIIFTTDKIYQ